MPTTKQAKSTPTTGTDPSKTLDLYTKIRTAETKLVGPDGKALPLPPNLDDFLTKMLANIQTGKSVTLLQSNAELTTVEAAKLLAVSRQFLIRLLEADRIPFHMVGTHRRVYARDVLAFKAKRDSARRKAINNLARVEMDEGLYDRVPLPQASR